MKMINGFVVENKLKTFPISHVLQLMHANNKTLERGEPEYFAIFRCENICSLVRIAGNRDFILKILGAI
jgi:hypothetical protein